MSDAEANAWPPKIAQLIGVLDQPLTAPTPLEWASALQAALGARALTYAIALAVELRAAGLNLALERLTEVAVHLIGDGKLPDAFDRSAVVAKADMAAPRTTGEALGKPKKPRGVGLRR